ncbi:hypothetical protein VTK73DRAFT_7816 [Phialemonium thermophilum]|uniref:Uncharacterized protein n=1 Tax=Phialemonium thermophilum TaxID=223376 RepID=A0ABR3XRC5_9PEZI
MLKSTDPKHFFETDAAQAKRERQAAKAGNEYGNPITLKSKILAVTQDPQSPSSTVFVAESTGSVRKVNVDSREVEAVYRGPTAPVTCVTVGGRRRMTVFAGSWDRAVWSWDAESAAPGRKYIGHADFVKAVTCGTLLDTEILISGGADKKIIVWDGRTGARLHTLQDGIVTMLAVQDLIIDPLETKTDEILLVSASSDPHIRRWKIRLESWEQVSETAPDTPGAERRTILEHETTVYKLVFDHDSDEVDLWTSSGDGTAKCLSRLAGFKTEDSLTHGDHVRAVAVTDSWVITAGRDEDLRIWERASGHQRFRLEGHFDEITDLVVLRGTHERLVSVSIDGTMRIWSLETADLEALAEEQSKTKVAGPDGEEIKKGGPHLTAEEEAELASLMDDDE